MFTYMFAYLYRCIDLSVIRKNDFSLKASLFANLLSTKNESILYIRRFIF